MTNTFDRDQSDYWFAQACRRAEFIGAVDGLCEVAAEGVITPERALALIRERLADVKAATNAAAAARPLVGASSTKEGSR